MNKYIRDISFLQKNSNNKCKRDERNTKSLLGKCHSNNCCRQDPPVDAKISGGNVKQNVGIVPTYLLQDIY